MAERFEWELTVRPEMVQETRVAVTALSAELLTFLPSAVTVVVLAQGQSVQVLDQAGVALDLSLMPFEVAERVCALFGPGAYQLRGKARTPAEWWVRATRLFVLI